MLRVVGGAVSVLLLGVIAGLSALRGSLPQYEGVVRSSALAAPVEVERDALGTVTVQAANRRDASWAFGYVQAQERFFQMDLLRRRAAGELSELFGKVALATDRAARAHRMRERLAAEVAALPPDKRALVDAYRDGVNAGLAALRVRPFEYLLTRNTPAPWRDEDTLLVIAAMAFTLNDAQNGRELALAQMHAALPDVAFRFLAASGGAWDAPLEGAPLAWPQPPDQAALDLHGLETKLLRHDAAAVERVPGSNSLAVSGALAGGAALIANDMHLDLGVPSLWFRARLVYPDPHRAGAVVDISGAMLPGAPAFVVGSNGNVAWGFTNGYVDTTDWVRVTRDPADAARYLAADGPHAFTHHAESIRVHGAPDEILDVEETHWGPVLGKDVDGTPLALAWTAQERGAFNVDLMRLESATSADEAVAIAQSAGIPPQNVLVADRAGAIEWTIAGRIPRRSGGFDPELPADWSKSGVGWNGWLEPREYPLVANPPGQRLWTANQRMVEGALLAMLGDGGYDLGARARQLRDDLRARDRFTPADLLAIQLDDRALFLEHWKDLMRLELDRAPASPLHASMREALAQWNGRASTDSVAYRLVRSWRNEVIDRVLDGFAAAVRTRFADFSMPKLPQAEHAVWMLLEQRPANLLPPGERDWDAFLAGCADTVAGALDRQPGGLAARTWGERNTARIAHAMSRGLPAFAARWLDMPHDELPGDANMPRVQGPAFGASERFGVAPGDEAHGYFMMPGGQSDHPLSPYHGSGHADWVRGTPTPFLPGPAEHVLRLLPR
jgi:penicillin G amidase